MMFCYDEDLGLVWGENEDGSKRKKQYKLSLFIAVERKGTVVYFYLKLLDNPLSFVEFDDEITAKRITKDFNEIIRSRYR